jgi:hypothetical protein
VVAGAFQIAFRAEIHANDVFSFFKNHFWYQHIKTIQKVQTALNFSKKKKIKFDKTQLQTQYQTVSTCLKILDWQFSFFFRMTLITNLNKKGFASSFFVLDIITYKHSFGDSDPELEPDRIKKKTRCNSTIRLTRLKTRL